MKYPARFLLLLLCLGLPALAEDRSSNALARELVEVMGADELPLREMRMVAEAEYDKQQITRAQRDCVLLVGRAEFTPALARIAEQGLSAGQARDAIAYFRSAVGKRHLEAIDARGNVSARDWQERRAFLDTQAGYLLITRQMLTGSEARGQARSIAFRRMRDCKEATDKSPQAQPAVGSTPKKTS